MRTYIDSADVEEVRHVDELGLVDGVTTNPSLVSSTDKEYRDIIKELDGFVGGPISVEVIATDYETMLEEAREYDTWGENIAVKLPMTRDGMRALQTLSGEGVQTNITLIFSANQALVAAKNGATMVSPFIGRLDDIGHDGVVLVEEIRTIYDNYDFETDILAASLRHPKHVKEAAMAGVDIATLPTDVAEQLFDHPKTDSGLESFLTDWGDRPSPALDE
jgi:transaldolase